MILDLLRPGPKRDLLTPFFTFKRLLEEDVKGVLFDEVAKLRFEVYCQECKYLDESDFRDGKEVDDFDGRSIHVAAFNLEGAMVGTVRLVLAGEAEPYPFEEHCQVFPDFTFPPRDQCGEVSRLIVRKSFRRRAGDSLQGVSKEFQEKGSAASIGPAAPPPKSGNGGKPKRGGSSSPQIMLGMYRELYRYSRKNGINYWYAAMEKGLAGLLDRMGFHFIPVGPEMDYYGPVTSYIADLRTLEADLRRANLFLAKWFHDEPISLWLLVTTLIKFKFGKAGKF